MNSKNILSVLYWIYDKRWLLCAALVVIIMYVLPVPRGLSILGWRTLSIAVAVIILIVTEPIPLPGIALFIAVMQVIFGVGTPNQVASTFMSDAVVFIIGSLMLAVVIVEQNLDRRLAYLIVRITGVRVQRITLGFVLVSAISASFIGEHTVAAIMLPVAISLIRFVNEEQSEAKGQGLASLILIAIAYGCAIGGLGTPSGGARNAIMIDLWSRMYDYQMTYSNWILYAYPLGLLHIPILIWILRRTFYPERASLARAVLKLRHKMSDQGHIGIDEMKAIIVFAIAFILWIFFSDRIGLGAPALISVFLAMALGIVEWKQINVGVNWGVVLIYASTISLGVAFKDTGAGDWLATQVETILTGFGINYPIIVLGFIAIVTMLIANMMGHGPAVALFGPIALIIAQKLGVDYITAGFVTAAASSYSYLTVIGSPAATIVYSSGDLQSKDFLRAGFKLTIASLLLILVARVFYWPLLQ